MNAPKRSFPLWLKWFLSIVAISLIAPLLGSSPTLLYAVIVIGLMLFPGTLTREGESREPRLIRALPWIWVLNFLGGLLFAIDHWVKPFLGAAVGTIKVSDAEILLTLLGAPVLLWIYYRKRMWLVPGLAVSLLSAMVIASIEHVPGTPMVERMDVLGSMITDAVILVYVWRKTRSGDQKKIIS